jgi:hypothetical protein
MIRLLSLSLVLLMVLGCREESKDSPDPDPALVYFLVAETNPVHGDSFILPLKSESDIEQARAMILAEESPIIVAEISIESGRGTSPSFLVLQIIRLRFSMVGQNMSKKIIRTG